ncbi:hypothetical protein A2803_01470 [Candidatus Woesebacteria bacterium RIFCSPHIGHO2_01_FULL_44_21]|uniref:Uncharacterized protein n=1 Tax=Candidatus Woesebacteria bacterium RIFCSPHIGHO2_01_FULL_44_21 TaxID=1802503 RepID=A0A1F7Z1V7_9BACT|nr:MAG: hypothetical protein A2803_01470 [Candidatus Woesebacteria bacterium RIFCSPHIGHO2_01_FULL_44_21]
MKRFFSKSSAYLLSLIFLVALVFPKNVAAIPCEEGNLPSLNHFVPPSFDRAEDVTIRIISAPPQFQGQTIYFEVYLLTDAPTGLNKEPVIFPQPIQIDASGNGEITINFGELAPTSANGFYRFDITGEPYVSSCITEPSYQIEVFGDSGCLPLETGDTCDPNSTTPICLGFVCVNGLVTEFITTFDHICINPDPPTCRECENFPDGTRVCGDLSPARPVNCPAICAQEPTDSSAFIVSRGCDDGEGRVSTAIGCIPFTIISETARFFLAWSLSIGGGIALLLIGISAFMLATSSGNPQKVESAKSLFWAALTGLGMLILSVFLLRFIGVEVLELFG